MTYFFCNAVPRVITVNWYPFKGNNSAAVSFKTDICRVISLERDKKSSSLAGTSCFPRSTTYLFLEWTQLETGFVVYGTNIRSWILFPFCKNAFLSSKLSILLHNLSIMQLSKHVSVGFCTAYYVLYQVFPFNKAAAKSHIFVFLCLKFWSKSSLSYLFFLYFLGRVAQSVGHLTRKSGVLGSIPGLATYFRFSFRFFKKGSCQLLAKVCARSTG